MQRGRGELWNFIINWSIRGWLSCVCPASAITRARTRIIGPVKIGPCVGASSTCGSVRASVWQTKVASLKHYTKTAAKCVEILVNCLFNCSLGVVFKVSIL